MSDWLATHTGIAAIEAGLDMDMPGGIGFTTGTPTYFGANITMAVYDSLQTFNIFLWLTMTTETMGLSLSGGWTT